MSPEQAGVLQPAPGSQEYGGFIVEITEGSAKRPAILQPKPS